MAWSVPPSNRSSVNSAGRALATQQLPLDPDEDFELVNQWRSAHSFPLNTLQNDLRRKAKAIAAEAFVVQRTKRLESIHRKLVDRPLMKLSQMQDIGGCRAVMPNMAEVGILRDAYRTTRFAHEFHHEKDYISSPKPDGYRSIHLIYRYKGRDKTSCYDGLKIEVQLRSQLQHAWATAVEAVGIFTQQALKSNRGPANWRRLFVLMSGAISAIEGCAPVQDVPKTAAEISAELSQLDASLNVVQFLSAYRTTIRNADSVRGAKFVVLRMDFAERVVELHGFSRKHIRQASALRDNIESTLKDGDDVQVVLISADSLTTLRRAYPNYFLDTTLFASLVNRVLGVNFPDPRSAQ